MWAEVQIHATLAVWSKKDETGRERGFQPSGAAQMLMLLVNVIDGNPINFDQFGCVCYCVTTNHTQAIKNTDRI